MNISKTPTTHLLVRAYTNSEWDSCYFALITLTEQWLEKVKKVAQQVATLKSDPDFVNLSFYEVRTDFLYPQRRGTARFILFGRTYLGFCGTH